MTQDSPQEKIKKLFELTNPKEMASFLEEFYDEFADIQSFYDKYSSITREYILVEGKGFQPVAVTLGGLMSIAGVIVSYLVQRDTLRYVITSPEVVEGKGFFALSHKYMKALENAGMSIVVVPFNDVPKYNDAEKLLAILKQGAIIVQGVSAELAMWLGRNAGVGRLIVYRPEGGKGVFKYI